MANMEIKAWNINFLWVPLTSAWNFLFFGAIPDGSFLHWDSQGNNKRDTKSAQTDKNKISMNISRRYLQGVTSFAHVCC